ncbi:MAG: 50S ribosomal protein L10 [Candidatus Pacebacteria bacterium]|nr:50S ribosomal protein L10 [Candidatus Paceibacterota bacterium]
MPKTKEQKNIIVEKLKDKLSSQKANVFLDFAGVDSKTLFKLRDELKAAKCGLEVVKKTLLKKALAFLNNRDLAKKVNDVEGQLALAFGFEDEVAPAKICRNIQKENENLRILGGVFSGQYWGKEKMLELAELPPKNELLGRLVGSLQSPIQNFACVLNGNIKGLMNVLSNIKK